METFESHWAPIVENSTSETDFMETAYRNLGDGDLKRGRQIARTMPGFNQSLEKAMRLFDASHWQD